MSKLLKAAKKSFADHFKACAAFHVAKAEHHEAIADVHDGISKCHKAKAAHHTKMAGHFGKCLGKAAKDDPSKDTHEAQQQFHEGMAEEHEKVAAHHAAKSAHHGKCCKLHKAHAVHFGKAADWWDAEVNDEDDADTDQNKAAVAVMQKAAGDLQTSVQTAVTETMAKVQGEAKTSLEKTITDMTGQFTKFMNELGKKLEPTAVKAAGAALIGREGETLEPPAGESGMPATGL